MKDEKEERKKLARSNKQTRQSNTAQPRQSLFLRKMSCLDMHMCFNVNVFFVFLFLHQLVCLSLSLSLREHSSTQPSWRSLYLARCLSLRFQTRQVSIRFRMGTTRENPFPGLGDPSLREGQCAMRITLLCQTHTLTHTHTQPKCGVHKDGGFRDGAIHSLHSFFWLHNNSGLTIQEILLPRHAHTDWDQLQHRESCDYHVTNVY